MRIRTYAFSPAATGVRGNFKPHDTQVSIHIAPVLKCVVSALCRSLPQEENIKSAPGPEREIVASIIENTSGTAVLMELGSSVVIEPDSQAPGHDRHQ